LTCIWNYLASSHTRLTMTDCGASGSALDRATTGVLSVAIGSQGNVSGEASERAGKAISNFLGIARPPEVGDVPLMLNAPPDYLFQPSMASNTELIQEKNTIEHRPQLDTVSNAFVAPTSTMLQHPFVSSSTLLHMPMQQQSLQMHPGMQIQAQMNLMNQQMAIMQINQRQKMLMENFQKSYKSQGSKVEIDAKRSSGLENAQKYPQHQRDDVESAINDLHADFESMNHEYDTVSTAADDSDFNEGYVEGASIEQLSAAWREAEKQIRDDFDESDYLYSTQEQRGGEYEFCSQSEAYGLQYGGDGPELKIDLMAKGMKNFQDGNITDAILCFESEVRNVDPDNSDAWLMLGKCHAENDEDRKAIDCLEKAVERDPYSGEALLALGVSYVNELNHERALKHLKDWVTHNPYYSGIEFLDGKSITSGDNTPLEELKSLLKSVVEFNKEKRNEHDSVDALEALGVLCNVSCEYDEAVTYFRAAATLRPDDYQLWNKVGATLANSQRSDEALPYYHKALVLKPKYARAWLNIAISHSNLKNHDEAARCYLQTLSLNPSALHIWSYLRIALTCSERWDLLPLTTTQNLESFKPHFDFIMYESK